MKRFPVGLLMIVASLSMTCSDNPQAPELIPAHVPVVDGQMLLILANSSPDTVIIFNYSQKAIPPSTVNKDSAWGANLLKKPLNPGYIDTIMSFTEESIAKSIYYRYRLKSGSAYSATLKVKAFNDAIDIPVVVN